MEHSSLIKVIGRRALAALAALSLTAAGMIPGTVLAAAPAQDPHAGHSAQQTPTPTPTPAPTAGAHDHHAQPQGGGTPTQTPQPRPAPVVDHSGHAMPTQTPGREEETTGPVMTLQELEALAAQNNPTLAQADAAVRAAEGRRRQAGLFPNPVVGYEGEELPFRGGAGEVSQHGFFVEQTIPLGGKLGKAKRVFERERDQAQILAEAQRLRVVNSVRLLYFEALGAQRTVSIRRDLARLAREAVEITKELYNVGQADRPDQLEIEIEAERAEIDSLRAQNELDGAWRALAAMVGRPDLPQARLAGNLEEAAASFEQEQVVRTLLSDSPEIRAARAGVERARAVVARERSRRAPDLFLRGGVGYSNELLESTGRKLGPVGNVEVGVTLPVFNRNQGGIAAAEAELAIAERELERLQLSLRTRLAFSFREYRNAAQMVERYRTQVVPRARQAYEMYLGNFRQMAASYPQVLIAQRTLFQVEAEYARALVNLRRTGVGLRGFLLEGGLGGAGEGTEGSPLRSANDATDDSDDR
jgi:outer membrane protein, heavy metal efflux system